MNAHAMGVARLPDAERAAEIRRLSEAGKAGTLTRIRGALRDLNRETPNDERAAGLQQVEAAMQRLKYQRENEARQAVVKRGARKAEKEQTAMTTKERSKWTPDHARRATVQAFDDGYKPVTIIPHTLTKLEKDAGKLPGACYAGKWDTEKDWAAVAETATLEASLSWYGQTPSAPNVGILCGVKTERGYLVGVDIDCDAPEVLEGLAKLCNGEIAVRIGRADRSGLVPLLVDSLEVAEVFSHESIKDDKGKPVRIQLLKSGKQFVARGIHPGRLAPYQWARFDAALGGAGGDCDMPSVAQLPLVKLADVLAVFEAAGFRAGDVTKSENASAVKAELLSVLENDDELDGDDYEAVFGDDGLFPLSRVAEGKRAFAKNVAEWGEDYEPDGGDVSHHSRRVGFYKDILRVHSKLGVAHVRVLHLSGKFPGLGRYTGVKEGDGSITDKHIANAFEYAKRQIAAELRGGEAFGPVEDEDDDDESGETERPKAEMPAKAETDDGTPKTAVNVVYLETIRSSPPRFLEWSVKHFIARGTTAVVSGQWGGGKTAIYLDIALHIAAGLNWHGKKVKQGVVIYCGLENPEDIARRVRAWSDLMEGEGHDLSGCAFVQHKGPLSLVDVKDTIKSTKEEKALIKTAQEAGKHFGMNVAMIVIDTVSASISPGNDREHAGPYMKSLERISQATGANVTALHHPKKTGEALRGGGEFFGNGDAVILVSRDEKTRVGSVKASSEKFRIGDPSLVDFNYVLTPYKIGVDEDGEDVNVILAVEHGRAEAMGAVSDDEADARLERWRFAKFEYLEDYVLDYMRQQVAGAGDEVTERTTFLSDQLREAVTPALDHFAPHTRKRAKGEKLAEQRRKQFARLLAGLVDQKRITVQRAQGRQSVVRLLES